MLADSEEARDELLDSVDTTLDGCAEGGEQEVGDFTVSCNQIGDETTSLSIANTDEGD